jgi:hypothetical protein
MPGAEQTNQIAWAIHDEGKEVGNVATEYAHVQGFQFREGGELSAKDCGASIIPRHLDGRIHDHRDGRTADASQLHWCRNGGQSKSL